MKKARKIVYYGSLAVIAVTVCFLVYYFYTRAHEADVYKELQSAVSTATPAPPPTAAPTAAPTPTPEPHPCPVDFAELQQTCADIYAWIEIPGLDIAYPVVQSQLDDAFYLRRDIEGKHNTHGAIYSEASVNGTDFTDYHTILYGHNMRDNTMFGRLNEYADEAVLQENRDIYIYTPQKELRYRIFAAVSYSNDYIPYYFDDTSAEDRQAFLDSLPDTVRSFSNHILDDLSVTADDRLLILSTCTGNSDHITHRYLVIGVLQEETEWTPQAAE